MHRTSFGPHGADLQGRTPPGLVLFSGCLLLVGLSLFGGLWRPTRLPARSAINADHQKCGRAITLALSDNYTHHRRHLDRTPALGRGHRPHADRWGAASRRYRQQAKVVFSM